MHSTPKIIKSSKFEDGTYAIKAPVHPLPMLAPEVEALAVDPVRAAAEAESQAMLSRARFEAEAALAAAEETMAAREQALRDAVEAERLQVLAAAREEGIALGLAEGRAAGEQAVIDMHAAALERLHTSIEQAATERELWFESQQKDLIKLSLLIAQKILAMELAVSRESVAKMAEAALKHVTDKTHVRLRVHPGDLPLMNTARAQLILSVDNLSSLEIVGDPSIGLGGCTIDTRTGMVDAKLSTMLAEIASALLDVTPGPDGPGDLDPMVLLAVRALGHGAQAQPVAAASKPTWQRPAPAPETLAAPAVQSGQAAALAAAFVPAREAVEAPAVQAEPVAEAQAQAFEPAETFVAQPEPVAPPAPAVLQSSVPAAAAPTEMSPFMAPQAAPTLQSAVPAAPPAPTVQPSPAGPQQPAVAQPPAAQPAAQSPNTRLTDPSRRAADALSARLGKLKQGRGVSTLSEELDMTKFEGELNDDVLESIVRSTTRSVPALEIKADEMLVPEPYNLENAADALAARLGKKRRRSASGQLLKEDGTPAEPVAGALGDDKIDEIMGTIVPRVSAEEAAPAASDTAPDIDKASESLARLLGQPKKKSNRPWYEQ